ncbi:MAG TPA: glycosyltransferase [Anaerolineales bacterium]|nr:glycosyltransferase [Anaerolineales bacterium]
MEIRQVALVETEADPWGFSVPIMDAFKHAGYPCDYITPAVDTNLDQYSALILYGPMRSITSLVERFKRELDQSKVVLWFTEQLPSPNASKPLQTLLAQTRYLIQSTLETDRLLNSTSLHRIVTPFLKRSGRLRAVGEAITLYDNHLLAFLSVFTKRHACFFQANHIPARVIPMGYHPLFGRDLHLEKDIDVLFIGSTVDRRRRTILHQLREWYADQGVRFVIFDGSPENGFVFGKRRMEMLNRARIFINIFRQPWDDPTFRLLLAGANHTMLLSEKVDSSSRGPFEANVHFGECELGCLGEQTLEYLAHPAEIERITRANAEYIRQDLTMDRQVRKIIARLKRI